MASVEVKSQQRLEAERENEAGGVGSLGSEKRMCAGSLGEWRQERPGEQDACGGHS